MLEAAPRSLSEDATSVAAAAAGAALLLDRLQPQGGAGRGASADRGGALCDAWARAQRRCIGGCGGAARKAGDRLRVFLKPNAHFRLPADPDRPVIMIGPGTGVAPFRAFMQERDAIGARGRNWLVFGHRNYTHDFLYQLEWQDLLKRGVLTRLDVAFSRDQPEKRYVQHALWDARRELYAWVQEGAAIYVCGDANAMAKDVHATLQRILGEQGKDGVAALDALRREGRYLRDVY